MKRYSLLLLIASACFFLPVDAQPRFKGKRLDTTQSVLGQDSNLVKVIELRDSLATVGPAEEGLREPAKTDSTWMVLLVVAAAILILWAGRRAWHRQRK
jgi:hypothetical protein